MKRSLFFLASFFSITLSLTAQKTTFSPEYRRIHQGKSEVLVPEVHELANILIAISKIGKEDKNMVWQESSYYTEVQKHFLPFKEHPIMTVINARVTEVFGVSTYEYYYNFRMNSCAYEFKGNQIANSGIYTRMSFGEENDYFNDELELISDFSHKSGFRKFYADHKPYYDSLVQVYNKLCPINKMWQWIEREFPQRYQSYKVIFSPLIGGAHSTKQFVDGNFAETVMFISGPLFRDPDALSEKEKEAVLSRVVFTEIDHNYVNPTTEGYAREIYNAMESIDCWNNQTQGYNTPMATFNEYMTWGVFSLYLYDQFSPEVFGKRNTREAEVMAGRRGFIQFKEFNAKLLELYKNRAKGNSVYDLHIPMIRWSQAQKCD